MKQTSDNFSFAWRMYCQVPGKQELIQRFKDAKTSRDLLELYRDCSQRFGERMDIEPLIAEVDNVWNDIVGEFAEVNIDSMEKAWDVYEDIISYGLIQGFVENTDKAVKQHYKNVIAYRIHYAFFFNLALMCPEYYVPYFYIDGLYTLKKIASAFDIELPDKVPAQKDTKERLMYYMELCKVFKNFREEKGLSPFELWAFLFDLAPEYVKEDDDLPLPEAEQAWFIGGDKEGFTDPIYWGIKEDVKRGDIVVFYEMAPSKRLSAVCRALTDGALEPFFQWYSCALIGKRIDVPPITLDELRKDEYFGDNSFVNRNFQGMSKCPMSVKDYERLVELFRAKGFQGELPTLYAPQNIVDVEITCEQDVSDKLLIPRLEEMGWKYKKDFDSEIPFPAGRGFTGYGMRKRVDFALHLTGSENDRGAKVVIEVKEHMSNINRIEENFKQGLSYAKYADAELLVTCDKYQLRFYEKTKRGKFDLNHYSRFRWSDLNNLDTFHEIKSLLDR